MTPTQTRRKFSGKSLIKLPYICIVWFPQNGWHLMIPVKISDDFQNKVSLWEPKRQTRQMQPDVYCKVQVRCPICPLGESRCNVKVMRPIIL